MREARAEVTGRIDGIAGSASKRKTNAPDQTADEVRTHRSRRRGRDAARENSPDDKDEHKRADDFADEVGQYAADRGRRAEARELHRSIRSLFPMRQIVQPNKSATHHRAEDLRSDVRSDLGEIPPANGKAERHGRIQVRIVA